MPSKFAGSGLMIALLVGCAEGTISDTGSIPLPTTNNITTAHPNSSVSDSDGSSGDGGSESESESGDEPTSSSPGSSDPITTGTSAPAGCAATATSTPTRRATASRWSAARA
ncbi:hypothetical protein [Nannocystis pusilla]|uniref:hypothetical protein n=1 Tax=Nannocystis pusilla TaxID=889268 RepID=UPI003B783F3E